MDSFANAYADDTRAAAYAALAFPGSYHLAFRDLAPRLGAPGRDRPALDFGCGAGRSTRYLASLGFRAVGADISAEMLVHARALDVRGDYRRVPDGDLSSLAGAGYAAILAAFTFDNIPNGRKAPILSGLRDAMALSGRLVLVVSSPDLYVNEWASFSTRAFSGNRTARAGDIVRTEILDVADRRPVEDIFCPRELYRAMFADAGLRVVEHHKPLATGDEPIAWVNERSIAPWDVWVLAEETGR